MAEMVSSAIVGETVNRIMSSITGKDEEKSKQKENIERLEMAHIKMEAVLQVSDRWQITEVPLLRWRSKLKRAAQECDDTLLKCKQRALEEDETRQRMRQSSFPKRVAHATKSLISSFIGTNDESSSSSANVLRFERYANGANDFLKTRVWWNPTKVYVLQPSHQTPSYRKVCKISSNSGRQALLPEHTTF
jgi:predicted ATP-binding protein involved in virulence